MSADAPASGRERGRAGADQRPSAPPVEPAPWLDVLIEDPGWPEAQERGGGDAALIAAAAAASRAALEAAEISPDHVEISLLFADDARLSSLNQAFRGRPGPTNVLSWPSAERADPAEPARIAREAEAAGGRAFLGDVALALETVRAEADAAGLRFNDHVAHLTVHGVLHLLGFDHQSDEDADAMEAVEAAALAQLGVAHPAGGVEERDRDGAFVEED